VIEILSGTEVTWLWEGGSVPHDVRGDGFDSGLLNEGTFSHTFASLGTYDYECTVHNNMTGRVIVTE
jgi:plastocyanin